MSIAKPLLGLGNVGSAPMPPKAPDAMTHYLRHLTAEWVEAWRKEHPKAKDDWGIAADFGRFLRVTDVHAGQLIKEEKGAGDKAIEGWAFRRGIKVWQLHAEAEAFAKNSPPEPRLVDEDDDDYSDDPISERGAALRAAKELGYSKAVRDRVRDRDSLGAEGFSEDEWFDVIRTERSRLRGKKVAEPIRGDPTKPSLPWDPKKGA